MKKLFLSIFILTAIFFSANAQSADDKAIRQILAEQTASWNKGNIDEFMKGYWQSDSLMFIGKDGITYGYTNTLNNYKKNYNGPDKMGTLKFTLITVKPLSHEYYFVVGKWELERKAGNVSGYYDLIFRKMNGKWVIISDHSS